MDAKIFTFTALTYGDVDYVEKEFTIRAPLYHGGGKNLRGDTIVPGRRTNAWGDEGDRSRHVYFTARLDVAVAYAKATGGHVYEVEPTGKIMYDSGEDYKTPDPLTIIRKLDPAEWAQ